MKTVRRKTRKLERVLLTAREIKCYGRDDYYIAKPFPGGDEAGRAWLRKLLDQFRFATVSENGGGSFTLHVHSAEWYEFKAEGGAA